MGELLVYSMKNYFRVLHLNKNEFEALSKPEKAALIKKKFEEQKKFLRRKHLTLVAHEKNFSKLLEAKEKLLAANNTKFSPLRNKLWLETPPFITNTEIEISGKNLTIDDIAQIAKFNASVVFPKDRKLLTKLNASCDYITDAVTNGKNIYGVTTNFGGLSHIRISKQDAENLQHNIFRFLKAGAGKKLTVEDVRAGMVLRANSLLQGISAIRPKVINRLFEFLNLEITPVVYEFGSIGASGDLIPLASVGGAMIGLDEKYKVIYKKRELSCLKVLKQCHLPRIKLYPKEALAILNGTSMLTGIAANCLFDTKLLLHLSLAANVLFLQALNVSVQPFDLFIHAAKPHIGQYWIAKNLLQLLYGSSLVRHEDEEDGNETNKLRQDRYASRCLPQYLGPVIDGLETIANQITLEANSVTDNPLIDTGRQISLHGGNFLGEYPAIAMDQLRYYLGLIAKHLDVQIANLVAPAFNNGLPPSLIGNTKRSVNAGLKGLQICSNSIVPIILFMGNPIANLYPTYAEEYNQNINSQGYASSILARETVNLFRESVTIALLFGIQAVGLRSFQSYGDYDPRPFLSPKSVVLYEVLFKLLNKSVTNKRPYIFNDDEQSLDEHIQIVKSDIQNYGLLFDFICEALDDLGEDDKSF